jgi:hypothetical protein
MLLRARVFDVKRPSCPASAGRRAAQIRIGSFTTTLHYSSDGGDSQIGGSRPVFLSKPPLLSSGPAAQTMRVKITE